VGIGHVAVALGASRAAPRLNVGWLVFAALLADFLLGIFAALGLEHSTVPPDLAAKHYLLFTFPYSHGLVALGLWSVIFGFLISRGFGLEAKRIWWVVALVAVSHFVLDGIVHIAGLPLLGENSPKFGLGLWRHLDLELLLETVMAMAGVVIYWRTVGPGGPALSRYGMTIFVVVVTALTWTQLSMNAAPPPRQLAAMWIFAPLAFAAIAYGFDVTRVRRAFLTSRP